MKYAQGYIRDIPGGDPIPAISVTVRDDLTGTPIAAGGMTNCTTNPTTTDANGFFSWSCELSPGPIRVEATITGSQKKVRSGKELMQAGDYFISDIPSYFTNLQNGVIWGNKNAFNATSAALVITLQTGAAIIDGFLLETATTRAFNVPANGSFTERWDLLVLQQYVGGTSKGKQSIVLKTGIANQTDPVLNTDPNIKEFAIWRSKIANGGGVVTLTSIRVYSSVIINANQVESTMLSTGIVRSTATTAALLKAGTGSATPMYVPLSSGELSDFSLTGIATGKIPEWNGTEWIPQTHDHSGQFSAIGHDHSGVYSLTSHNHDASYQPLNALLTTLSGLGSGFGTSYFVIDSHQLGVASPDASSSDTLNYATALSKSVTLPAGTWTIIAYGSVALHSSAGTNSATARIVIDGDTAGSIGVSTLLGTSAADRYTAMRSQVKTGVTGGGSKTITIQYIPNAVGTIQAAHPTLLVVAIRTA